MSELIDFDKMDEHRGIDLKHIHCVGCGTRINLLRGFRIAPAVTWIEGKRYTVHYPMCEMCFEEYYVKGKAKLSKDYWIRQLREKPKKKESCCNFREENNTVIHEKDCTFMTVAMWTSKIKLPTKLRPVKDDLERHYRWLAFNILYRQRREK